MANPNKSSFEPRLTRRTQKCLGCGAELRHRRRRGRKATYCGPKCRRDAKSDREFRRRTAERISDTRARVVPGSAHNALNLPAKSTSSEAPLQDRKSRFGVLEIYGASAGGTIDLSDGRLSRETLDNILWAELGLGSRVGRIAETSWRKAKMRKTRGN
jgi:hypothetical protein